MDSKISVIIPTFNRRNYLERTIKSIQAQNFDDFEILVVDDGSTDDTKEMMSRLSHADRRIRYFYQQNSGRSAARNLGIKNAGGEWLLFLDSDDLLAHGALSFLTSKIEDYPQAGMIGGTYIPIDENDNPLNLAEAKIKKGLMEGLIEDAYPTLINNYYLPMGSYIVRHDIVNLSGSFKPDLDELEDFDFCLTIARNTRLAYFDKVIAQFRRHQGNTSSKLTNKNSTKLATQYVTEIKNNISLKNRSVIISEWKKFIADYYFNQKEFRSSFYNYAAAAFYNPVKLLNKGFCKQVISCLIPESLKYKLKDIYQG